MRSPVAVGFLSVVLGAMGALCTGWAIVSFGRGEYLTLVVVLGFAVFSFGMVAMMAIVATRNVAVRVEIDDAGTTFRPDRRVDVLLMASTIGVFAAMAFYAIFAPLGMVDIPLPRGDRKYFVFTAIAGALVGLPSLRQMLTKRGMSYLQLSANGFETGNTTSSVDRRWDEVADVAGRPAHNRGSRNTGTTYITTTDGRTRIVASDWYAPGGDGLRALVHFYWQHPECRGEPTDGRAVERLADEI